MNLTDLDLSKATVVQWCNMCNASEAVHVIEVEFTWGGNILNVCHECLKKFKQGGLL